MTVIDGIRSVDCVNPPRRSASARARCPAGLPDIIKSKKAAARDKDLAVLDILEKTLAETADQPKSQARRPRGRE